MATKKVPARRVHKTAKSARRASAQSPRSMIRTVFDSKGPEAAIKYGVKLPGMSDSTVKRYVAYFASKAGKLEAKAAAAREKARAKKAA